MRLHAFDHFRGIAILFIVAGHSYGSWSIDSFPEQVAIDLIAGGTALFVFISGFFFHHVFYPRFQYGAFMVKKMKFVLAPYLLMSALSIGYFVYHLQTPPFLEELLGHGITAPIDHLKLIAMYLWTGKIEGPYWYIPFAMIMFALSPLFIVYIRLPTALQIALFVAALLLGMYVGRPPYNLAPLHSVVYFTPAYMLGIMVSLHRETVMPAISGKSLLLGIACLSVSVLSVFNTKIEPTYTTMDLVIIHKLLLCLFLLSLLNKHQDRRFLALKFISSASFAIYFLHPWALRIIDIHLIESFFFLPGAGVFLVTTTLAISISLLMAMTMKALLREKSRAVIGW